MQSLFFVHGIILLLSTWFPDDKDSVVLYAVEVALDLLSHYVAHLHLVDCRKYTVEYISMSRAQSRSQHFVMFIHGVCDQVTLQLHVVFSNYRDSDYTPDHGHHQNIKSCIQRYIFFHVWVGVYVIGQE